MIRPFGEAALLIELDSSERAQLVAAALRSAAMRWVVEAVPGLESVMVELYPAGPAPEVAAGEMRRILESLGEARPDGGRRRVIPVVYGGEMGPDLAEVAGLTGLAPEEVVELHASADLRVRFCGFAPGFGYLGDLPESLRLPRLVTPRTRTPAGSVAIAGSLTGVYPADLPGGWRVIGRTPLVLFDPGRDPPAYLRPGDVVRFEATPLASWDAVPRDPADW